MFSYVKTLLLKRWFFAVLYIQVYIFFSSLSLYVLHGKHPWRTDLFPDIDQISDCVAGIILHLMYSVPETDPLPQI